MAAQLEVEKEKRSWEEYITLGMEAREDRDTSQWRLGDLAGDITKDYGEDSIGKFAYDISIVKKSLLKYRTVSQRFSPVVRNQYRKLSFSHFSVIASKKIEKPEAWLEQADNNEWSVEHLRQEVNKIYKAFDEPDLNIIPKVIKCDVCGKWRLEDISYNELCRGHYELDKKKGLIYE